MVVANLFAGAVVAEKACYSVCGPTFAQKVKLRKGAGGRIVDSITKATTFFNTGLSNKAKI